MKTILFFERDVDFPLLKRQKEALVGIAYQLRDDIASLGSEEQAEEADDGTVELLDGLINFLDAVQDKAAQRLGEEAVYGP